jgi:hypothetical protein
MKLQRKEKRMKLRNKKTGDMVVFGEGIVDLNQIGCKNVVEMIEAGWADYEEPKDRGKYIISCGDNYIEPVCAGFSDKTIEKCNELGMLFETEEEAEKAVEKLKAWTRLKDKGFKVNSYDFDYLLYVHKDGTPVVKVICDFDCKTKEDRKDLDLLFGGEDQVKLIKESEEND